METDVPLDPIPPCRRCGATHVVRNGFGRVGSPNFLCRGCGRNFVAQPQAGPVPDETQALVRRLLLERMGLRAIARAVGVSRSWVQQLANTVYRHETPADPGPLENKRGR